MNVLVTGGAGYIGRFCVRRLVEVGHDVVVLDRRPVTVDERETAPAVVGDIADESLVETVIRDHAIQVVLHLAAEKSVVESMADPGEHFMHNVCGTLALLEAMRRSNVTKLVFSSSAAVYGETTQLPVREDSPLRPENPYGSGKLMVEQLLHWYYVCHGFDSVSLRYFNAAGAAADGSMGEDLDSSDNLIPRVMKALLGVAGPVPVFGTDFPTPDGTAVRDYVHVEDLAEAHVRALDYVIAIRGDRPLNLGTGRGSSVREVFHAAERASGMLVPYEDAARRPGDPAASWADATQAERALGWRATRDLGDIVTSAWLWTKRNGRLGRQR